nr:putative mfs-type transporter [Quercus suber]
MVGLASSILLYIGLSCSCFDTVLRQPRSLLNLAAREGCKTFIEQVVVSHSFLSLASISAYNAQVVNMAEFAAAVAKAPAHGPNHTMDSDDFAPGLYTTTTNTQDFAGSPTPSYNGQQDDATSRPRRTGWRRLLGRKTEPVASSEKVETSVSERYLAASHSGSTSDDEERRLEHVPTGQSLKHMETTQTTFEQAMDGTLYRDGALVMQPAPSQDPRDPLNLNMTRKIIAVFCLCFFGALAASAELILGAMLPVFALEYAGIPSHDLIWITQGGLPEGGDPLKTLESLPNAKPIWEIYLLASLPVLMIGLSNLILIPGAISCGRRPVILLCGVLAIGGAIWAGFSQSLGSHLGARCVQALGAGTVESLIPFIIQDIVFVHQRNTWISGVFAAQGVIIIALGISAPYIIIYQSWRDVYFITAGGAAFFLIGVFFLLPETRWPRTRAEMSTYLPYPSPPYVAETNSSL